MQRFFLKGLGVVLGFAGFCILAIALYPLLEYEWESGLKYPLLTNPISLDEMYSYSSETQPPGYPRKSTKDPSEFGRKFTLSVPRLKIQNALVKIGGEDLSESLIQFPGTAYPGEAGNTVIFGHSVLPIFYNPEKYITIFSTLPRIKKDDEILVNFDGSELTYKIEAMFEVEPTDLRILEQDFSDSYISLITCTPPGDPRTPRRLIVRAKLIGS